MADMPGIGGVLSGQLPIPLSGGGSQRTAGHDRWRAKVGFSPLNRTSEIPRFLNIDSPSPNTP